jgi:hypothetical protein
MSLTKRPGSFSQESFLRSNCLTYDKLMRMSFLPVSPRNDRHESTSNTSNIPDPSALFRHCDPARSEKIAKTSGAGTISSNLKTGGENATANRPYNAAIDGLESLILTHACVGVDVQAPAYIEGIETAVEAIANHLT